MKKVWLLSLTVVPVLAWSGDNVDAGCAKVGASMYIDLTNAVVRDQHIDAALLQDKHVTVDVLEITPVSEVFAEQMAATDVASQTGTRLRKEDFFESYYTNGAKSITAKYTFINAKGQRDVFIASSLLNNDECSVRFNGYLTLSREF
ncbi:Shiga toxin A subunit [Erwinia mallotivora]|uniref:Shiga toxin A subunit n=1 Tax=Erwinia mallotivora TaxID=69222 RepID=UPI0021C2278A|nr:Shiga toxin A subunit [Erwinia mallotivora]